MINRFGRIAMRGPRLGRRMIQETDNRTKPQSDEQMGRLIPAGGSDNGVRSRSERKAVDAPLGVVICGYLILTTPQTLRGVRLGPFLDEGEIDELSIHVIPTLIGEGLPLIQPPRRLIPLSCDRCAASLMGRGSQLSSATAEARNQAGPKKWSAPYLP
jgi:hypothetical protein